VRGRAVGEVDVEVEVEDDAASEGAVEAYRTARIVGRKSALEAPTEARAGLTMVDEGYAV
jgi:hypothetical protein